MRVTKTIREYIEEQVRSKAMQSPKLVEAEQKKDKAIKDFLEDKKRYEEVCQTYVDDLVKKYQINVGFMTPRACFEGIYEHKLPESIAYHQLRSKLQEKARQTALDIIIEMELGGTKAELMDKLNTLKF